MRNMLAFLAAVVIVLVGIGWYLDWFKFSIKPDGDGHQKVTIDVDTKKAGGDVSTAVKKGEEIIEKKDAAVTNTDGNGLGTKIQNVFTPEKGIEVKTKSLDVNVPVKDFQFPQR